MAVTLLLIGYALLPVAWWLHRQQRWKGSILLLVACGFLLRFGTSLDPTLHPWDERYHALVAKRLSDTPLTPRLIPAPELPHDPRNWTNTRIWLHKPPMALWCIAASIKVFGTEPWAVRLPSTLLAALAVWLLALLARSLFSAPVGFWAAFLFAINGHLIELASGRTSTDHVDAILVVFVLAALFAAWNMVVHRSFPWAILAGIVAGCAFLTKSWPALLTLPVAASMAWSRQLPLNGKSLNLFATMLLTSIALVAPWMFHVHSHFPVEFAAERTAQLAHFTEGIEEHARPWYYYLEQLTMMQGEFVLLAIVWAVVLALRKKDRVNTMLLVWVAIPYVVYSIAMSKMPAYTAIAAPAIHIITAMAYVKWRAHERPHGAARVVLSIVAIGLIALPLRFSLDRTAPWQQVTARYTIPEVWSTAPTNTVVTDCPIPIELMFHTPIAAAYEHSFPANEVARLTALGYRVRSFGE